MNTSNRLEVVDGIGQYRLVDSPAFREAVQGVTAAISMARERGLRKLLVVLDADTVDFDSPGIVDRHAMVREWAEAAQGMVRVAMVVPPGFIDAEKFGVVAAANFGLAGNAFNSEAEAMAWLRDPH